MKKPAIGVIPFEAPHYQQLNALKQNIEILTGRAGGQIGTLGGNATLSDCINKLNEILDKLQS